MSRDLRPDELNHSEPESPEDPAENNPRLTPTRAPVVAAAAVAGALIGFGLVWAFSDQILPVTPWTMSTLLAALGVAAGVYSRSLARSLARARADVAPEVGVFAVVAGRTLLLVGALLAGGHLAYAVAQLGGLDRPMPRQRLAFALIAVLCSAVMAVGGGLLEKAAWVGGSGPSSQDQR